MHTDFRLNISDWMSRKIISLVVIADVLKGPHELVKTVLSRPSGLPGPKQCVSVWEAVITQVEMPHHSLGPC